METIGSLEHSPEPSSEPTISYLCYLVCFTNHEIPKK